MDERWAGRLRLAVQLCVEPEAFWRLSVVEWRALTAGQAEPALGREALSALMAAHPDEEGA